MPTATQGYISQISFAYTYDGAFVGRLVFELRVNATSAPKTNTCGSAGGKAVNLLPSSTDYAITKLSIGCAPLPKVDFGRRRRSLQERALLATTDIGLSAGDFGAVAAPLSSIPVDPVTGIPLTQSLGDVVDPQDPVPVPTTPPVS